MIFLRKLLYTSCLILSTPTYAVATSGQYCTKKSLYSTSTLAMSTEFQYPPGSSSVAFVTAPDDKIAKKLAHGLVKQKLAACVNIIPNIQSVYMWEGKVNEDDEYLMMIKTQTSKLEELTKWVRDNHPYSVAEVITLPIEKGNLPYMKWLAESVPEK